MKRAELNVIKEKLVERSAKASDLDVLVEQIMKLPYGQLKKVLTDEVLKVLAKYGYTG